MTLGESTLPSQKTSSFQRNLNYSRRYINLCRFLPLMQLCQNLQTLRKPRTTKAILLKFKLLARALLSGFFNTQCNSEFFNYFG